MNEYGRRYICNDRWRTGPNPAQHLNFQYFILFFAHAIISYKYLYPSSHLTNLSAPLSQVYCIFLFLCAASLFGTIIAQVCHQVATLAFFSIADMVALLLFNSFQIDVSSACVLVSLALSRTLSLSLALSLSLRSSPHSILTLTRSLDIPPPLPKRPSLYVSLGYLSIKHIADYFFARESEIPFLSV